MIKMKRFISAFFLILLVVLLFNCKEKKRPPWIDMRVMQSDGSFDDKYLFKKEIEEEQQRTNKYKKDKFD
jgi:hypothetical protein